jgi:integrase/recombinase XerD
MSTGRTKTYKYKDFCYTNDVKRLLSIELSNKDKKKLHSVYSNYYNLDAERGYEFIIEDLFKLAEVHKLSTSQIAQIYDTGIRNVQIWLKELGINRSIKKAQKINKKNSKVNLELNSVENSNSNTNSIQSKYGIEQVQIKNLPESVVDFLNYLETIKGKSPNTIKGYEIDLTLFFRFLKIYKGLITDDSLDFSEIDIRDIDNSFVKKIKLTDLYAFLSFAEKQRENGSYARARKVAALKSYFKFLNGKAKIIDDNPTLELESPKINKRHPVYLSLDESVNLLSSLDKDNKNYYRDYCILTLFLNCGMRLSELCSIKLDKIKGDTLTIIGKGDKERTVYLNEACLKAIDNYLAVRDTSKCTPEDKEYLLLSSRFKPINKRTVELLVKKHIFNSGLSNEKYTPHKLRHTAATLMYKHGNVDIRSLQSILGHENISTTQIYTHVDEEILRDAVNSNPLSKL